MSKIADATFRGKSNSYQFEVYTSDTIFNDVGAVYIFTQRTVDSEGKGSHNLLYIGQTDALGRRISNHEKWPYVQQHGVNCICVHRDDDESSRLKKETDLLGGNKTPCND
jgi:predicted GIY-YIG superfamily endonuclease